MLHMSTRIQVVVDETEREAFRRQAEREGVSLSTWLREAGHRRLEEDVRHRKITTVEDLREFFASLPDREDPGGEPDWEEHKRVIDDAMRSGDTGT